MKKNIKPTLEALNKAIDTLLKVLKEFEDWQIAVKAKFQ